MRFLRRLSLLYDLLLSLLAALVGALLVCSVILVVADVLGRYFFQRPIGWVFELTEHILVAVPFLGMAWLVRRAGGHVRVEIVVQLLPPRLQSLLNAGVSLLAGLTCGIASYWALVTTWDHFTRGIMTYGIYPLPRFILIALIAVGLGLTTIEFLRKAYDDYHAE
jgi:TRAP-type transport system small permease protein